MYTHKIFDLLKLHKEMIRQKQSKNTPWANNNEKNKKTGRTLQEQHPNNRNARKNRQNGGSILSLK